jgi:hypothetical protein
MRFWGLVAWALLGFLGLVIQTVYFFKDPLATYHPSLKPLLLEACQLVGCHIRPLQKTDAVVIDFGAVDAIRSDEPPEKLANSAQPMQWALQINLRNADAVPVATPWVELTLTDAQDAPVMRKVLNPVDWGAPAVLSPGEIIEQQLLLSLKKEEAAFTAYRLLTFYP